MSEVELAFAKTVLDGTMYRRTLRGVDELIAVCRSKPGAVYETGDGRRRTMRQVVEDNANRLEEYRPELARQLDRVARNGCE